MKSKYLIVLILVMTSCLSNKGWIIKDANINEGLHDIEILNKDVAITYSYGTGSLYKTLNAGKSWQKTHQFDSIYFEQIQFLDEEHGWIVGSPNKIYSTQDGGKSWTDRSSNEDLIRSYIYGMWFENIETGYISALRRNKKGFSTTIFKTQNGGISWESVNQIDEMILNLENINGSLYATGNNIIVKNVDRLDWSYVYTDTSKQVGQIRDIEQNETGEIYAASFNGYIIEISNEKPEAKQITKNRIRSLVSVNNHEWIAVGDSNEKGGNLFTSLDNGKTWAVSSNTFPDIHRIKMAHEKLWMVGKKGLIMTRKK